MNSDRMSLNAYAALLNAFLLFLVQPLFARMALPLLGGSPAVWTTCMLFFQAALFAGYLYVHGTIRLLGVRRQTIVHALVWLTTLVSLPLALRGNLEASAFDLPAAGLLTLLTASIGVPFFALSTSAPLLQRWLAEGDNGSSDPYRLYAASNIGSLAALLAYPTIIEPFLSLRSQLLLWSAAFTVNVLLIAVCALRAFRSSLPVEAERRQPSSEVTLARRLRWLSLSAMPSALMLAVTAYISTDLAATPVLWTVPLALYLTTFIAAFGARADWWARLAWRAMPLAVLPVVMFLASGMTAALWFIVPLHLLSFWLVSLVAHSELARCRPDPSGLTTFYVWMSAGGLLGGLFNALLAPAVFVTVSEYPVLLAASVLVVVSPAAWLEVLQSRRLMLRPVLAGTIAFAVLWAWTAGSLDRALVLPLLGISAVVGFSVSRRPAALAVGVVLMLGAGVLFGGHAWGRVLAADRSFYGTYRVVAGDRSLVSLYHGTTLHGSQQHDKATGVVEPLTYYHRRSPIGEVLDRFERAGRSVGVVGLGVGSLAAYARAGERWTFYEIDPVVERLARETRYFRFLDVCGDVCRVEIGDGRLALAAGSERFDLLVVDAFSSDAIPIHLITREAIKVYMDRVADHGLVAFHISNRHFDLEPVLGRLAAERGFHAATLRDELTAGAAPGASASTWVVMTRTCETLERLSDRWQSAAISQGQPWTDDFSSVWGALRMTGVF